MNNHITAATLNIHDGLLQGKMKFSQGLNIISGENGTFKTRVLQLLRSGPVEQSIPGQPLRIQAISPKRNSERHAIETILQLFRQNSRTWEVNLSERLNGQINDTTYNNYPSLADLFYLVLEHRCKDGKDRNEHMLQVTAEFNTVIRAVFPHYKLLSEWDVNLGAPRIRMNKLGIAEFPIEGLSLGEQEVLSLITSINAAKDDIDVYLIDEPEVHLNWHLEEGLFAFLDDLCQKHSKQVIVVTHSRTIFKPRFLPYVQFLYWSEDGKVKWARELSSAQKRRLAGDAIEIIALGEFSRPTFFVEDDSHSRVLRALANLHKTEINISICGNSSNVKSLFKYQKTNSSWPNTYFLIDGDNQGNPYPTEPQFIHLPVYCIENIFLDPDLLAATSAKSVTEIRKIIIEEIRAKRKEIFHKNKFFEFLIDALQEDHITYDRLQTLDASIIVKKVADRLGSNLDDFIPKYLLEAQKAECLEKLVPVVLLTALVQKSAESEIKSGTEYLQVEHYMIENSSLDDHLG
jgi:AAA domain, putative AbiEii toxin, Type IV TA system